MRKVSRKIKGAIFITRQANHHAIHLAMGIAWFYLLKRLELDVTAFHFFLAILGSEFPDMEHVYYWFFGGKTDVYSLKIRRMLKHKEYRKMAEFVRLNHKHLTKLRLHTFSWALILSVLTMICFARDMESWVVFTGAMALHYYYDMIDDIIFLGKLNPNWTRGLNRLRR